MLCSAEVFMMFLMPSRLNSSIEREPFKSALLAIKMTACRFLGPFWPIVDRRQKDMQ